MNINLGSNPLNFLTESNNTNTLESYNDTKSFFSYTLEYIKESNREFDNANKAFYKAVVESQGDSEIINESFHDFAVKVKDIIDKFIKFIKSLFDKFLVKLNAFVSSDKFIEKHKKDLDKFGPDHEFEYNGYDFTFKPNIPSCDICDVITEDFVNLEVQIKDNLNKPADMANALRDFYDENIIDLEDGYFNKYRATVIGASENILMSDFDTELFATFRDGNVETEPITVDKARLMDCYSRFTGYKKAKAEVEREKKTISKEYEDLKNCIYDMTKSTYNKDDGRICIKLKDSEPVVYIIDKDSLYTIDLFVKSKANQIQEMSNIHALAFSAKLDAMKACFKQDKAIIYKALSKVTRV